MPASGLRVGFVGVGHMGRPMVDRLVAAGWSTEVYVRRRDLRDELLAAHVPVATSVSDLAARSDLLVLCLFSDAQVREVILDGGVLASLRPGSVLVSHVTGSPDLPLDLQAAAPPDVAVLDVPISGTEDHIRNGRLTLLVGGDGGALARVRPALQSYADPILHVGALGDGQRIKLLNNLLFTANLRLALEAARLGEHLGIATAEMATIVGECSGDSFALRLFQHVAAETMTAGAKPYLRKDVAVIRDVASSLGLDLGLLGELSEWVDDE